MEQGALINVKVKAPNKTRDVVIALPQNDTIGNLRQAIIAELGCAGKNVRMISAGKLLDPDTATLTKFAISDGSFIHIVISDKTTPPPSHSVSSQHSNVTTLPSHLTAPPPQRPVTLRGFDRLVQHGLTLDEAAALRSSFRSQVDAYCAGHPPTDTNRTRAFHRVSDFDGDSSSEDAEENGLDRDNTATVTTPINTSSPRGGADGSGAGGGRRGGRNQADGGGSRGVCACMCVWMDG